MSVRKRLERLEKLNHESIDIDALIDKGAKVKEDLLDQIKKWAYVNVRISVQMIEDVDDAVCERVGITRTGWILEAIHEKLKRQKNDH